MRSVGIAELKNKLSSYVAYAKAGETVVIRDRNLPVARLVPFEPGDASEEDLRLIAAGHMRLGKGRLDVEKFLAMPRPKVEGNAATQTLIEERNEGW